MTQHTSTNNDTKEMTATIFDIQHFSLHDGPGVRSTVFFKGCPLSCQWCSNPESQKQKPELMFFRHLCTKCGACIGICPTASNSMTENGIALQRSTCTACGDCVTPCMQGARTLSGKRMTVTEICDEVRQYWRIFMQSGGGITCSGGEVLQQGKFAKELFATLHDELGLHTCLDTCGAAPWSMLEEILPYIDYVLFDMKHMDSAIHKEVTGIGNEGILHNVAQLAKHDIEIMIRLPLLPTINDDDANLHALGAFLKKHALPDIEIMPYHVLGVAKYAALDMTYPLDIQESPRTAEAEKILQSYGRNVHVHMN